jgi:hypothetical protein
MEFSIFEIELMTRGLFEYHKRLTKKKEGMPNFFNEFDNNEYKAIEDLLDKIVSTNLSPSGVVLNKPQEEQPKEKEWKKPKALTIELDPLFINNILNYELNYDYDIDNIDTQETVLKKCVDLEYKGYKAVIEVYKHIPKNLDDYIYEATIKLLDQDYNLILEEYLDGSELIEKCPIYFWTGNEDIKIYIEPVENKVINKNLFITYSLYEMLLSKKYIEHAVYFKIEREYVLSRDYDLRYKNYTARLVLSRFEMKEEFEYELVLSIYDLNGDRIGYHCLSKEDVREQKVMTIYTDDETLNMKLICGNNLEIKEYERN